MALHLLLAEDDDDLRAVMVAALSGDGHDVREAADGESALRQTDRDRPQVLLLDVGLGAGPDGVEVCRQVRRAHPQLHVVMLTARDTEADVVLALEAGADDYLTKPVGLVELRSRVRAVERRLARVSAPATVLRHGDLELDTGTHVATAAGSLLRLTPSEFAVLEALLEAGGNVRSRRQLNHAVFGDDDFRDPRAIDVHVHHLREKLAAAGGDPALIATVRGSGYRLGA